MALKFMAAIFNLVEKKVPRHRDKTSRTYFPHGSATSSSLFPISGISVNIKLQVHGAFSFFDWHAALTIPCLIYWLIRISGFQAGRYNEEWRSFHCFYAWLPGGSLQNTRHWPVSVAQDIELLTHALSGVTIIFIRDKEPKYLTVQLNTGHLAHLIL